MKRIKRHARIAITVVALMLVFTCLASAVEPRATYWLPGTGAETDCGSYTFPGSTRYIIQLGANTAKYNLEAWLSQDGDPKYGPKWMSSEITNSYKWTLTPANGTYDILATNNSNTGYYINFAIYAG